jgi:cell division protein DivIC
MLKRLPAFTKNFYFIFGFIFLIWMLFIDSNDLFSQYSQSERIEKLEEEKAYYQQKIKEVEQDREELLSNKELLEKFAREKYLMKKKSEDVYVIVEEED